ETEHTDAGRTPRIAPDDRDARDVVEATRQHDADQGGAAVAGRQRERARALPAAEESTPSECLQRLREQQQQAGRDEQPGLAARERPGCAREVPDGEHGEPGRDEHRPDGEAPADQRRCAQEPCLRHACASTCGAWAMRGPAVIRGSFGSAAARSCARIQTAARRVDASACAELSKRLTDVRTPAPASIRKYPAKPGSSLMLGTRLSRTLRVISSERTLSMPS